ncbi:phage-Barnase-EndoU-ColicinE5/D-RelE like nuclease3 [anaerobic digester metagenome]
MAASEFLKRRVEEEKKKTVQKPVASAFLQNLAKGSKETALTSAGAKVTYDNNSMGLYKAAQRVESDVAKKAGTSPALRSSGGTINPANPMIVNMPTVDDFKALLAKKQPTVNINLDKKPIQSLVTVNPTLVTATKKAEPIRSTAKDRKTMLYETNDSLLSPQEVLEKYRYVVNDSEMDVNTRNLAAKKGLAVTGSLRDKSIFSGERNPELVQAITALQGDLTYMTKGYARGKGYGDAYGLNYLGDKISDNYVEKSGDAQLKAAVEARKKLGQKTVEDNPLSVMAGRITGEGIKYGAFSPLIESQVAKATTALGTRMGASTASTTAQQLYALGRYNPAISKGLQFGGNILGQQAADTLLTTPTVILEGVEAGKGSREIAKDVAKQQAIDLGFNLGFGVLQVGGKALKNASKKGPVLGVDLEKIKYEHAPVDDELIQFKQNVDTGKTYSGESYLLKPANRRMVSDVSNLVGFDISGYKTNAKANAFAHIENRHGKNGIHDHSMSDERDLGKIQYVLDNYDSITMANSTARGYKNSDNTPAKSIIVSKRINGTYYVVEAVPNSKRQTVEVVSAYKSKTGNKKIEDVASSNARNPQRTSDNVTQQSSVYNSISINSENINQILIKNEGEMTPAEMKELGFTGKVTKLLDVENKKALDEELESLVGGKEIREKYEAIVNQYGYDSQELKQFIQKTRDRKTELAETLGYADNVTLKEEAKVINEALREIRAMTGVSGKENTVLAKDLLKEAAADVRQYGRISRETKERIFNEMASVGKVSNREMIDQNLKNTLKKTVLRISKMDAANIPDFKQFRKSLFGKIGGISKGGRGEYIDVAYSELHSLFPERFPGEIMHPAEQLAQIARVADDMKVKNTSLLDMLSKEERASLKESFHSSLGKVEENLQRVAQRQIERREKQIRKVMASEMKMNVDALSTKDMEKLFDDRYQVRKELKRANKRASLTNSEKLMVTQLLHGDISFDDIGKIASPNLADMVKRITDVYHAEKQLRQIEGTIKDYRAAKSMGRTNFIADTVGEIRVSKDGKKGWRDMNPILMGRSNQERILEKITDKETGKRIIQRVFEPIHTAERDRQLFMKGITDKIKKLNIDTKKKYALKDASGQTYELSESGLVHYLGSKRYQLQTLERKGNAISQQDVDLINKLRSEVSAAEGVVSKEQLAKIDRGIREFQDVYKNIHPRINEVLIRNGYDPIGYIEGYFPNMFFDDATDPMGKALQKLGFDFASKELPMDIAGRTETFRPGKKWAGNLLERTSDKTDYDALRAMDKYLDDISDVIYHTDNIKKLREYEEYLRYTLSPDGVKAEADAIKKNPAFSDEEIREKLDKLYEQNKQNHTLQNYVNNIRRYTDLLAGKKHSLDRALETDVFGRSVYKAVNTLESRVGANMVAGNIGSALTNVIPITQGMSPMSTGSNLKGLKEAMQYMFQDGMDDLTKKSAFLTTRQGREMLYQTGLQKATNIAVAPMELMDKFSTQAVWRSRYYENIKRGFDESRAILEADDYSRRLFAGRSKGAMPTYFHSKALKPLTMFQLEVNNQLDFLLKDLPKEAHGSAAKAMKIYSGVLIGAYMYNDMYEKLTGRRSALDPIGIANEAVKDFAGTGLRNTIDVGKDLIKGNGLQLTEETGKRKASEAAGKLVENIGGNVPFVGGVLFDGGRIPLSAADPGLGSVGGAVINATTGDGSWERAGSIAMKNLTNPLYYAALPFGGSQVRKTIGGLNTMAKGGSYSITNKGQQLQFAVDQSNPASWAKAGVFGKWALPEAQGYLDGQTKAFSEKRTSTYEKLKEKGIVNMQAHGAIGQVMQAESSAGKRRALRLAPIKEEGRPIIYYDLLASDKDKGVMDTLKRMGEEDDYTIYDCVERIADSKADNKKRNVLLNSKLSEESKKYVYQEKVTKDDDERIYNFSKAGMNIDKFLEVKNYLYISANRSLPTAEKREMFVNWVLEKGYSKGQREVIFESFNIGKKYRR